MKNTPGNTEFMIDISMNMEQYDCPFIDTTVETDVAFASVHREFDRAERQFETGMVVEGADRGALTNGLERLRAHDRMADFRLVKRRDDVAQIRTVIEETSAMATIRGYDGYITGPFHVEDGSEGVQDGVLVGRRRPEPVAGFRRRPRH